jgi:hypothetical protein
LNLILHLIHDGKSNNIFVVNDPTIIESVYLGTTTKRKPDIILLSLAKFRTLCGFPENANFLDCCVEASGRHKDKKEDKKEDKKAKPTWLDVIQFWELKAAAIEPQIANILISYNADGTTKYSPGQYYSNLWSPLC